MELWLCTAEGQVVVQCDGKEQCEGKVVQQRVVEGCNSHKGDKLAEGRAGKL